MNAVLTATPGQTVGPFFGTALPFTGDCELVPPGSPQALHFHGSVTDGGGQPVTDALIEIWQADEDGNIPNATGSLHRDGWTFTGWGRAATDSGGQYHFSTLSPGATTPGGAPFIAVTVFARGLLNRLFTRAYLPSEESRDDPLLKSLPVDRRHTLIATRAGRDLRFDIRLQGDDDHPETIFLRYAGR